MLKVALDEEEKSGFELMAWWSGEGAARVFECDGKVILLERAQGQGSLVELCHAGRDDEACRIICSVVSTLHHSEGGWRLIPRGSLGSVRLIMRICFAIQTWRARATMVGLFLGLI